MKAPSTTASDFDSCGRDSSRPRPSAHSRTYQLLLVITAVLVVGLCSFSPPASAVSLHALELSLDGSGSSAGAFSEVGAVVLHESTGDLYVIDRARDVVDKFDLSGTPKNFSATGTSSIDVDAVCPEFQFASAESGGNPGEEAIAVDNSGGSHDGNIYIGNPSAPSGKAPETCAFSESGEFLWRSSETAYGFAVSRTGSLWMSTVGAGFEYKVTDSGLELETVVPNGGFPIRIALDASSDIYFFEYYGERVSRYTSAEGFQNTVVQGAGGFPGNALAVDPLSDHLYVATNGTLREYSPNGISLLSTFGEEIVQNAEGLAVDGSTGRIYVGDTGSNRVLVFGPVKKYAQVTTGAAQNIRRSSATVAGEIDPDDGGAVTGCHVEYGVTKEYGQLAPCDQSTPYNVVTGVTASISGLTPGATYHYRVFATDASGTNRGKDHTFSTPYVSEVRTNLASDFDRTSATLHGSLDPEGVATKYYFQWGLTTGYGNTAPVPDPGEPIGSASGDTPVQADISGLVPNSTYHFRVVGVNASGKTLGGDQSFKTIPPIRNLSTGPATEIGADTVVLTGSLDPDGFETHYHFEWGRTPAYEHTMSSQLVDPVSGPGAGISTQVSGLDDYTSYHYRVVATNSFGTTVGDDRTFRSEPPFLPAIRGMSSSNVTDQEATISARINPGLGPTMYRFQYGTDTSYESRTALTGPFGDDGSDHVVTAHITNLRPGTAYHFGADGVNFRGASLGEDAVFVTPDLPGIDGSGVSAIEQTSVRLVAQISPSSSPTTYRFEYGPTPTYGSSTAESPPIGDDRRDHSVESLVSGLLPGTTYHFRVVASNRVGSVSGADATFTTASTSAPPPARCKKNLVKRKGKCVRRHKKTKNHSRKHRFHHHG